MLINATVSGPYTPPPPVSDGDVPALTTSGPTTAVTTRTEFYDAYATLSNTVGGGTITCAAGNYGEFRRYPFGSSDGGEVVIIKPTDINNPPLFTNFYLREVDNIRVENVLIDGTSVYGYSTGSEDIFVQNCTWIQFVGCTLTNDVNNIDMDLSTMVRSAVQFRQVDDGIVSGFTINGYRHGISLRDVRRFDYIGNETFNCQGDGMRGGGWQNVLIKDNYFHDFVNLDYAQNHPDLIQIWGTSVLYLTQDVTINNNILMTTNAAAQSIFIKNESFGQAGVLGGGYENLVITDNLIFNNHIWGIHLDGVDSATISNNTLLKNNDSYIYRSGVEERSTPEIYQRNSDTGGVGITFSNNIAKGYTSEAGVVETNNKTVEFSNTGDPDYVTNHFVNPLAGNTASLADLDLLGTSAWFGSAGCTAKVWPIP